MRPLPAHLARSGSLAGGPGMPCVKEGGEALAQRFVALGAVSCDDRLLEDRLLDVAGKGGPDFHHGAAERTRKRFELRRISRHVIHGARSSPLARAVRACTSSCAISMSPSEPSAMHARPLRAPRVATMRSSSLSCSATVSRFCVLCVRKTMRNFTMVVPVLITSCQ